MSADFWMGILIGLMLAYAGWFTYAGLAIIREVVALARNEPAAPSHQEDV